MNNWQFLNLLATCWRKYNIQSSAAPTSIDLAHRKSLENIGVRALTKYEVIKTNLFKNQTCFSIFGADILQLRKSLQDILEEKKLL